MSKKDKDAAYHAFLADLAAINPQIEELVKDERVSSKLREGVLARSEFSSNMDAIAAERKQLESYLAQEQQKIEGWQRWYGDVSTQVASMQNELNNYRQSYGDLDATAQTQVARQAGYLTKEEFERELNARTQQRDLANLKFADDLTDIKIDYRDRFNEKLPTDEVYRIAGERGLSLDLAYNVFIADRVEEQKKQQYDAEIKRAREEAVAEYASQHNLPVMSTTSDVVHTLDAKNVPVTAQDRVAAAVARFNQNRMAR